LNELFNEKDNTSKHTYKYIKETIQFLVERVNMIENRNELFETKMDKKFEDISDSMKELKEIMSKKNEEEEGKKN
jgi:hypothetical protein